MEMHPLTLMATSYTQISDELGDLNISVELSPSSKFLYAFHHRTLTAILAPNVDVSSRRN